MKRTAAVLCATALFVLAPRAEADGVVLGMRDDAPPFSFMQNGVPSGYVAQLCAKVFADGTFKTTTVVVDAAARKRFLSGEPADFDVLCDPVTVTLDRAANVWFSPLVFAAGTSYAENLDYAPTAPGSPRVGYLDGTTAAEAVRLAKADGVVTADAEEAPLGSHADGVDKLCAGDLRWYFADRDILVALLGPRRGADCRAAVSRRFFTYEPYALATRRDRPEVALHVQARVLRLFATGEARHAFDEAFATGGDGPRPSQLLETLFQLNTVEALTP